MKLKNFRDLITERFSKDEIALIEKQAELEVKSIAIPTKKRQTFTGSSPEMITSDSPCTV